MHICDIPKGRCLLLDSVLVFALVLRYTATRLRNAGASAFLPLDHNVYIHKIVGWVVFALSWTHSLMHLCTFSKFKLLFFCYYGKWISINLPQRST